MLVTYILCINNLKRLIRWLFKRLISLLNKFVDGFVFVLLKQVKNHKKYHQKHGYDHQRKKVAASDIL